MSSILAISAVAAEEAPTVTPRYVNIMYFNASINVNSSGKVSSYAYSLHVLTTVY